MKKKKKLWSFVNWIEQVGTWKCGVRPRVWPATGRLCRASCSWDRASATCCRRPSATRTVWNCWRRAWRRPTTRWPRSSATASRRDPSTTNASAWTTTSVDLNRSPPPSSLLRADSIAASPAMSASSIITLPTPIPVYQVPTRLISP